jgi:hypothetical protein
MLWRERRPDARRRSGKSDVGIAGAGPDAYAPFIDPIVWINWAFNARKLLIGMPTAFA